MGAPIMIDDGGSIRLKLALKDPDSAGVMDSLFDVKNGQSEHERTSPAQDPYSKALIFCLDEDGDFNPANPAPSPFKRVLITGDSGINVEVSRNPSGIKLEIKVMGNGVDPAIESKQHNRKRSYVVLNAGRITQIDIEDDTGTTTQIPVPSTGIYTNVVIT